MCELSAWLRRNISLKISLKKCCFLRKHMSRDTWNDNIFASVSDLQDNKHVSGHQPIICLKNYWKLFQTIAAHYLYNTLYSVFAKIIKISAQLPEARQWHDRMKYYYKLQLVNNILETDNDHVDCCNILLIYDVCSVYLVVRSGVNCCLLRFNKA